jgi:hypothetical protein
MGWLLMGGCGLGKTFFGAQGEYLLYGTDALTLPGEEATLEVRLAKGDFLDDQAGVPIVFTHQGEQIAREVTDGQGTARLTVSHGQAGDYFYQARVAKDAVLEEPLPEGISAEMLIRCRQGDQRLMVVDLDKTVVASGFDEVLIGDPQPMSNSADVLRRCSERWDIVYLTHRPEYFRTKSRQFLEKYGFPTGPLLLSRISGFVRGSGAYKRKVLESITARFNAVQVGVGDKYSDVEAYHAYGLRSYLILPDRSDMDAEDLEDMLEQLRALPGDIQAVDDWRQVERGLFDGREYPVSASIDEIQRELAGRASRSDDDDDDDDDDEDDD